VPVGARLDEDRLRDDRRRPAHEGRQQSGLAAGELGLGAVVGDQGGALPPPGRAAVVQHRRPLLELDDESVDHRAEPRPPRFDDAAHTVVAQRPRGHRADGDSEHVGVERTRQATRIGAQRERVVHGVRGT
jgi:hypothetical protein